MSITGKDYIRICPHCMEINEYSNLVCVRCGKVMTRNVEKDTFGPKGDIFKDEWFITEDEDKDYSWLKGYREAMKEEGVEEFDKYDEEKTPLARFFYFTALQKAYDVIEYGARKYSDNNGKKAAEEDINRYYSALLRHAELAYKGEELDSESGIPHLVYLMANAAFLQYLQFERNGEEIND